ncbi:type II toxin-antitoxin system Phd/YefM family antitoxin [Rhizobium sp. SIMBA_035]
MTTISLKDAKAGFSDYVEAALHGEFITITRHGKPTAVLVSVEAAEVAKAAMRPNRPSFSAFLQTFPGDDAVFERNSIPSRDIEL